MTAPPGPEPPEGIRIVRAADLSTVCECAVLTYVGEDADGVREWDALVPVPVPPLDPDGLRLRIDRLPPRTTVRIIPMPMADPERRPRLP